MFLERQAELDLLHEAARLACTGTGRIVVVSGEAGVGKTMLLRKFHGESKGVKVYWGGSDALFTPQPLGPLRDMVSKLDEKTAQLVESMAPLDKIFSSLLGALQDNRQASVLIFEDAHWADNSTLDLIKFLGRRISFIPCVLILTIRTEETGRDHPLTQVLGDLPPAAVMRIGLAPLSLAGIANLSKLDQQEASALHAITGGNPFFATELLANGATLAGDLPASVRDAVWARLQRLASGERELLEAISISPSGAESWFAEALLGRSADADLHACVERGILAEDNEGKFRFRHELARVATQERIPASAQRQLHRKAFEVLSGRQSFPLTCLVHHAAGAGLSSQVLTLAPHAAAEAVKLGSHREAVSHLAMALRHAGEASGEVLAKLNEEWAYEASLVQKADDEVLAAMSKAVDLWRGLGNKKGISRCLRRISRLHWLRGEGAAATRCASEAVEVIAGEPACIELAMANGVRAQLMMFNDRFEEAIEWSRKAIALAEEFKDDETRIHSLNNLGHSLLYQGKEEGRLYMEECLRLALQKGLHEQVNRAYINYGEYAVVARQFDLAERILAEGIAFSTRHDLDFGTYYLLGRQAQLRMDQGRLAEAEEIASRIVSLDRITLTVRFPARIVLAKTRVRRGHDDGLKLMRDALEDALATEEQQNIVPARIGLIEAAWLHGDMATAQQELKLMMELQIEGMAAWDVGDFAVWWRRCGMAEAFPLPDAKLLHAHASELRGDFENAAREWDRLGLPYEAVLSLMSSTDGLGRAVAKAEELGAVPAAALARLLAERAGLELQKPSRRRGPYGVARKHPLGLTAREIEVLDLLGRGRANPEIAHSLACSRRTVEHHVSAIISKFSASNRMDIVLRLHNEPWLLTPASAEA